VVAAVLLGDGEAAGERLDLLVPVGVGGLDGEVQAAPLINYISIAGVLGACARRGERPLSPLNLLGDFGGCGMLLGFGIVCALLEARGSGRGQVVDAAMVAAWRGCPRQHALRAAGQWSDEPGTNFLDSGAHRAFGCR
jgi:alpha-methylacyl-CoA racemase